jgi:quercetin dioxygenase-like cupin family protein
MPVADRGGVRRPLKRIGETHMSEDVRVLTRAKDPLVQLPSGLRAHKHARTNEIDLTEYFFETGMTSGEGAHAHAFSTAVLVTSGRFQLSYVDGPDHELVAGDSYVAKEGQRHMVTCLEAGSYVVAKPLQPAANGSAAPSHDHDHVHSHS